MNGCGGAGNIKSPLIDKIHAVDLLGTMHGGPRKVGTLVEALDTEALAPAATQASSISAIVRSLAKQSLYRQMHCERLTRRTVNLTCVHEQALKKILSLSEEWFDTFYHVETQVQTAIDLVISLAPFAVSSFVHCV